MHSSYTSGQQKFQVFPGLSTTFYKTQGLKSLERKKRTRHKLLSVIWSTRTSKDNHKINAAAFEIDFWNSSLLKTWEISSYIIKSLIYYPWKCFFPGVSRTDTNFPGFPDLNFNFELILFNNLFLICTLRSLYKIDHVIWIYHRHNRNVILFTHVLEHLGT